MSDRPSLQKQAEEHLKQALEADSPGTKNFHIRSALQFAECMEATDQAERSKTD